MLHFLGHISIETIVDNYYHIIVHNITQIFCFDVILLWSGDSHVSQDILSYSLINDNFACNYFLDHLMMIFNLPLQSGMLLGMPFHSGGAFSGEYTVTGWLMQTASEMLQSMISLGHQYLSWQLMYVLIILYLNCLKKYLKYCFFK